MSSHYRVWSRFNFQLSFAHTPGAVAGLVFITPAAGFVGPMPALIIGVGAGVVCSCAVGLLKKIRIDDSLAVLGVHGIGGTWGAIATGLFVGVGFGGGGHEPRRAGPDPGHQRGRRVGLVVRRHGPDTRGA